MSIWIICLFILTKSFAGLLLKTYSTDEFVPIVNNLDEIYEHEELAIAGRPKIMAQFKDIIDHYSGLKTSTMVNRMERYQRELGTEFVHEPDVYQPYIIEDVILQNAIILVDTNTRESIIDIYSDYKKLFTVSEQVYLPQAGYFLARKDHIRGKLMKFL